MLLKDRFLKKVLLKITKIRRFFLNTVGSNNSFTLIEKKNQGFKIAKFEFKVTVHYGQNAPSCESLNICKI